jgi:hypothetical protein
VLVLPENIPRRVHQQGHSSRVLFHTVALKFAAKDNAAGAVPVWITGVPVEGPAQTLAVEAADLHLVGNQRGYICRHSNLHCPASSSEYIFGTRRGELYIDDANFGLVSALEDLTIP